MAADDGGQIPPQNDGERVRDDAFQARPPPGIRSGPEAEPLRSPARARAALSEGFPAATSHAPGCRRPCSGAVSTTGRPRTRAAPRSAPARRLRASPSPATSRPDGGVRDGSNRRAGRGPPRRRTRASSGDGAQGPYHHADPPPCQGGREKRGCAADASPPPGRGKRGAGASLVMTAPGRSQARPAIP